MSLPSEIIPVGLLATPAAAGGAAAAYTIDRSVRLNSADSAYLSRTPSSAGNRKTWTWSGWVKRSGLGIAQAIFGEWNGSAADGFTAYFTAGDVLILQDYDGSFVESLKRTTTQVFRDVSAWYHIVVSVDTTDATADNRVKLYVNGSQVTTFSSTTNPAQNSDTRFNRAQATSIGRSGAYSGSYYFPGYLADVHFIDGQALDPTSFGEFDEYNNWQPKEYTGTYGPRYQGETWSTASAADSYAFDGSTAYNGSAVRLYGASTYHKIVDAATAFTNVTSVVVGTSENVGSIKLDGTIYSTTYTSGVGLTVISPPSSFSDIEVLGHATGLQISYVRVNGELLIDSGVISGNNSFHLNFSDATSTTTIAEDSSGNNNHWTANNFVVSATSAPSTVCGEVAEGGNLTLTAPTGYTFTSVTFASYGTPSGSCPSFTQGGCHASNSQSIVEGYLIGNSTATIPATNAVFGDPCGGTGKKLAVVAVATFDGSANDSLFDSPTNSGTDTGAGGEVSGGYATLNPLQTASAVTLSNGNLDWVTTNATSFANAVGSIGMSSGKWYCEITMSQASSTVGICKNSIALASNPANDANAWAYYWSGNKTNNGSDTSYGASYTTGDVISVAFDADAGSLVFYKNGSSQGTAFTGLTSGPYFIFVGDQSTPGIGGGYCNFGQRPFAYDISIGISEATGAIPILSTSDDYGQTLSSGTASDSNSSSIVLALPMNGTNGGTTFTDYSATIKGSGSAKTVTASGDAQTSTAESKWYGSSLLLDGTGDYLDAGSGFAVGTGDFTAECWARFTGTVDNNESFYSTNNATWTLGTTNATVQFCTNSSNVLQMKLGATNINGSTTISVDEWYHVAVTRESGTVRLFLNGQLDGSGTATNDLNSTADYLRIGQNRGGSIYFAGNIQDFRFYNGVAKYTSSFTPPSSALFKALCTANLDEPTVPDGSTAMNVVTWSGDGASTRTITVGFEPDLIWEKVRNNAQSHLWYDAVRGFGANKAIGSNSNIAEGSFGDNSGSGYVSGTTSTGFSIVKGTSSAGYMNDSGYTQVAWCWDAGSSTVSNTDGSITSSVRANPTAGFSVITASTPSQTTNYSCGHGLGVAPEFYIWKFRDVTSSWIVYHKSIAPYTLKLDSTAGQYTGFNMPAPSSSVINLLDSPTAAWNSPFVIYAFAPVEGYSAFGSYTGNGNTSGDGPFVYTGFRPKWLLVKESSNTNNWFLLDATRSQSNYVGDTLWPNLSNQENDTSINPNTTYNNFDFLSNGFKARSQYSGTNRSSGTFVYCAFAEHPFRTSRAR